VVISCYRGFAGLERKRMRSTELMDEGRPSSSKYPDSSNEPARADVRRYIANSVRTYQELRQLSAMRNAGFVGCAKILRLGMPQGNAARSRIKMQEKSALGLGSVPSIKDKLQDKKIIAGKSVRDFKFSDVKKWDAGKLPYGGGPEVCPPGTASTPLSDCGHRLGS